MSNSNLVEISKVEFLNNVKDKIVEQASTVPANLRAISGDETITVSWDPQPNVTGYEVKWTYIDVKTGKNTEKSEVVDGTSLEMKELDNFTEYTIMVQALNGDWRSGYSAPVKAIPVPAAVPEKPEGINLAGGYKQITVSWEKQKNSTGYNVYYRVKGEGDYQKIGDLVAFKYIITELKDQTEYEIYLTGYNAIGEGAKSSVYTCKTQSISPPKTPDYKLINTNNGVINQKTDHILSVEYPSNKTEDEFDIVDNDYTSYWNLNGWDAGGYNTGKPAPIVEFDEAYEMDSMILVRGDNEPSSYAYAKIRYWDENGKMTQLDQGKGFSWSQRKDTDGKEYYEVRLNNKAKIKKIQISTALYWAGAPNARNRISELKFYYYDSLANEVDALYSDDLHIELKEDVTMDKVDGLIERANTVDSISGEYHPQRETLLNDLNLAKDLLNDQANLKGIVTVDQNLSNNKNGNLQFAMALNDYQPLGVAAKAGDKVTVYVGTNGNNLPKLVCTQFYADVKTGWSTEITLKKGRNEITIPQIGGMDSERGGALYVRYPYNTASNSPIKVRIANAITIPVLNTAGMKEEQEIKDAIKTYLDDLKIYVNQKLPEIYGTADAKTSYGWNQASSIYNTTDLVSDRVMLTLPANAVLNELNKKASESDQINQLYDNIKGFDQLTEIAYKNWRGLEEGTNAGKNALPGSRINIRYARMFTGAFMYAAGAHIGIEYGSTSGVITGKPNTKGHDGTWSGGNLYGWGIAHEIGHVMDQSNGIYDETSNNVLSLYAQTYDEKTKARIEYKDVYKKVTSGTKGISNNVFTQLGMFWQLHLAYDTKANDPGNTNTFQ
ncbi:MAG: fibronectin type III domain-containing protein, partial [Eubacterium sp.]